MERSRGLAVVGAKDGVDGASLILLMVVERVDRRVLRDARARLAGDPIDDDRYSTAVKWSLLAPMVTSLQHLAVEVSRKTRTAEPKATRLLL